MDITVTEAADAGNALGLVAVLVAGVIVTGALIWAVRLGIGVRRREPTPPGAAEQPRPPANGPVYETRSTREPNEMPDPADDIRLTPHELRPTGGRDSREQRRPRWEDGTGGSFGSGGPGVR
ncbi:MULTISPECIES: DUF6479 family protein [unclassified Streptomyces]|uniref:DUF6479 family protein n=1 Tax=unclassified Streptomyces TaxID=2593676 RepID=UPI003D732B70